MLVKCSVCFEYCKVSFILLSILVKPGDFVGIFFFFIQNFILVIYPFFFFFFDKLQQYLE